MRWHTESSRKGRKWRSDHHWHAASRWWSADDVHASGLQLGWRRGRAEAWREKRRHWVPVGITTREPSISTESWQAKAPQSPANSIATDVPDSQALALSPAGSCSSGYSADTRTVGIIEQYAGAEQSTWQVGAMVERLLDDISDIWLGAIVVAVHPGDTYDIQFVDRNMSMEREVEACELRPRTVRLDFAVEIWQMIGVFLVESKDLCWFESIARNTRDAVKHDGPLWWCAAYHERLGVCGPRCCFARTSSSEGEASVSAAISQCFANAALGLTPVDRIPWKDRFAQVDAMRNPSEAERLRLQEQQSKEPGDKAYYTSSGKKVSYSQLDGRLRYGNNVAGGWYFDPRLGRMVQEC